MVCIAVALSLTLTTFVLATKPPPDWSAVDAVLSDAVRTHSFPGAVALVGGADGVIYAHAVGAHTYAADAPAMSIEDTLFDMASVTKVIATTTATMLLYQRGLLSLDTPLVELFGAPFAALDPRKADGTVRNLLLHNYGWPPDPTPVSFCAPSYGCPESRVEPPQKRALNFSCQPQILASLLTQKLVTPPGEVFVYSDISMISQMFVVGNVARRNVLVRDDDLLPACVARTNTASSATGNNGAKRRAATATTITDIDQCYYEAFVRLHVFAPTLLTSSLAGNAATFMGFRPPMNLWPRCAPTWNDTSTGFPGECVAPFRERLLQGEVCDGNAYAMGGVAGHAGLFAAAPELHALLSALLYAPAGAAPSSRLGVNKTTAKLFTTVHNVTQSSRALGWDTNNYAANTYRGCGNLSSVTFTHTGYTGTQLCADPAALGGRGVMTVLLTNRVYPNADEGSLHRIHVARQAFNNAVHAALAEQE